MSCTRRVFAPISFLFVTCLYNCNQDDPFNDPPIDPGDDTVDLVDSLFTSYYLPSEGFQDVEKSVRASDQQPIRVLEDQKGNSPDLVFRGLEATERDTLVRVPRLPVDQPATYSAHSKGMYFANVQANHFFTDPFDEGTRNTPFEYWMYVRNFRTLQQESILAPGSKMPHLRLRFLRFTEWGINSDRVDYPDEGGIPPYLKKVVIRMKYDPPNSQLYYNNVGLGLAPEIADISLERLGLGSNGHGQNHEVFLLGYIDGTLSDESANSLFEEIIEDDTEYDQLPQFPVAIPTATFGGDEDTRMTFYNQEEGRWFLRFDYHAENGLQEDTTKREYQWYWGDTRLQGTTTNFLNRQHAIPGATEAVLVRSRYASGNAMNNMAIFRENGATCDENENGGRDCYIRVSASIKLFDTDGNSFGEVQTDWVLDNVD